MQKKAIVKARAHHGSKSLDLTVPVSICSSSGIHEGDAFSVEVILEKQTLKLIYTRVFQQK